MLISWRVMGVMERCGLKELSCDGNVLVANVSTRLSPSIDDREVVNGVFVAASSSDQDSTSVRRR